MLTIRLQRTGTKNAASFRLVVAEKTAHVSKKFTEVLGHYNPRSKEFSIKSTDRLNYWMSHNTQLSPTVNNLLVSKGLIKGDKVKAFNVPKKEVVAEAEAPAAAPAPETTAAPEPEVAPEPEAPSEAPTEEVKE